MAVRIQERYEKRQLLGEGGMGKVWVAYDHTLQRDVAIKTIRDVRDKTSLNLFQKECNTLAKMAHPNIVEIYDVGSTDENGQQVPYFVMPLLLGKTLEELIRGASSRLTVERCVDILMQVCRGLQAAHDRGLIHRDIKPSNIFVLEDDSVKIIDFGVAHLVDFHTTMKFAGTLLYMAPEQIANQHKKPTPAADIYSLGVVAFEAFTRRRPIEGSERDDLVQRILHEIPPPAFQVNPSVGLPVSQVVHKAMAKEPMYRFGSAKEFGDVLLKAQRNEPIEMFSSASIEPRIQRAQKALEQGDLELSNRIISELESEALLHQELSTLRKATDGAIRDRSVSQLLETAKRWFDEGEYQQALQKVQEVLNLDPTNMAARTLAGDIENKRSGRQIDDWLRLAKQHLDNHAYEHARKALDNVFNLRPKEARAQQLMSEVDRREQEYQRVRQEKESEYNGALDALKRGELSSAMSRLERVLEMDRRAPDTFSPDRAVLYQNLYNQVRSEHDQLLGKYQEARRQLDSGNFDPALGICEEVLARFPGNPLFHSLKCDIEVRRHQEFSDFIARVDREVDAQADLDRKIRILEEALARHPGESHLQGSLNRIRSKRDLVESIVNKARGFEDRGQFSEALGQWEILRNIYPQYPGLDVEIERVKKRKQHRERTDAKGQWVHQIDQASNVGDYARALELCTQGLGEYPGDAEILTLQEAATRAIARQEQARAFLADAEADPARALEPLRQAHALDPGSSAIRQKLLDAILREAKLLIDSDWERASEYLQQAQDLDPGNALARSLKTLVQDRQQDRDVTEALSKARACQADGDLAQAVTILDDALALYPDDPRLNQLSSTLKRRSDDADRAGARKKDLDDLRTMVREAQTVVKRDDLESLFVKTKVLMSRYEGDAEFSETFDSLRRRMERTQVTVFERTVVEPSAPPPPQPVSTQKGQQPQESPWRRRLQEAAGTVAAALATLVATFKSLPSDLGQVRAGKLPWTRLAFPIFALAGVLLVVFGLFRIIGPSRPENPETLTTAVSAQPVVETIPEPIAAPVASVDVGPKILIISESEVQTTLAGSELEADGRVPAGEGDLEITGPDRMKVLLRVRIQDGSAPEVLSLKPVGARVLVASTFKGAARFLGYTSSQKVRVGFDEIAMEDVGAEGVVRDGLSAGRKEVLVDFGADRNRFELNLREAPTLFVMVASDTPTGTLKIDAGFTDVTVYINGRRRNFGVKNGKLWMGLLPGKLRVRVERAGYLPSEEQRVDLESGKKEALKFELKPIPPSMSRLHVANAAGVEIEVEGQIRKASPEGQLEIEVRPGQRRVRLSKPGHDPEFLAVDFVAGQTSVIDASKLKFKQIVQDGLVTFQGNPESATITITGGTGGPRTARSGESTRLPEGRYQYRAHAEGHDDYTGEFEIKSGVTLPPIRFGLGSRKLEASKPTLPAGMAAWTNASEWVQVEDGYWQNKRSKSGLHARGAGTFSFTTPCSPRSWKTFGRGDCKTVVYLTNGPSFEITDKKVKRTGGKTIDIPKITDEMRIRVNVTPKRMTLQVNGQEVESVDGDFTKSQFGVRSVELMKDFRYTPN